MSSSPKGLFKELKSDFPASVVVFLVALPLCLGIALASGAPLFSGIIAGVVGGIVIGSLSGSSLSVSGPAAGLVVIVLNAIDDLGTFEAFLLAVALAGLIQFLMGIFKAGIIGMFFPSSVIKGMLAAIGLILILKQIPHFLGFDADAFGEMEFIQADGSNTFSFLIKSFSQIVGGSLIVGIIAFVIILIWERPFIKRNAFTKQLPGGLIAVLAGVVINELFRSYAPHLHIGQSHLVNLPSVEPGESYLSMLTFPDFSHFGNPTLYIAAFTIAIIASLETLLSIEAVDKMDPHKRRTPQNQELRAQGIGNMISGLIGGLPITAVIVRSTANLSAGAKTKLSAVLHGIILMTTVLFIPDILNKIPLSTLAAILIIIGYKLTKPALYAYQYKLGREQFYPFIITVLAILFTDLLIGIIIGMVVGVFFILRANYKIPYQYREEVGHKDQQDIIKIQLSEHVTFLNKASLQLTLEQLPKDREVIIDGTYTQDIHHDALEVIYNFAKTAKERGITCKLVNVPDLSPSVL
jgi:MFS superfamily sulfate permease-like transporter